MKKKIYFFSIFALLILSSCNTIRETHGGLTYRYVYKGTPLYQYINKSTRGDSVGVVARTELVGFKEYLNDFWAFTNYWKYELGDSIYYVEMDKTGWIHSYLEDSLAFKGKLIVKTLILEGENAGTEKESMRIMILDTSINQKDVEYAPTITPDGKKLFFVSNRAGSKINENNMPSHDFWSVTKEDKYDSLYSKVVNIDTSHGENMKAINTKLNEGVATIAADGRTLFFTACNRWDNIGGCDIYVAKIFEGNWNSPMNLGRNVNSAFWDSHPSISPDMKSLYFSSNRPGPNGTDNVDIWVSTWDDVFEEWKPAVNLTAINTDGKEVSPFIGADGLSLFFASDGYDSTLGGLDFYVSKYEPETKSWSQPAHISPPLNTEYDEEFLSLPASGDILYFASNRQDIPGNQGELDLYVAFIEAVFRAIVIKVYVADDSPYDQPTIITVDNPVSKRKVRDKTSRRDNILSMVLTNADYGTVSDSLKYIDLNIKAENPYLGKKEKILRVKNPIYSENIGGWNFNNEIDETFEMSTSPELDAYLRSLKRSILDASVSAYYVDNGNVIDSAIITVEEFQSTNTKPLLPYIFFEHNSAEIPEKYVKIGRENTSAYSIDKLYKLGTLETYYSLLNIIGWRMRQYPEATITLLGCNSDNAEEKGNLTLSRERAENIRKYLNETWNIDTSRIMVESRNLPVFPSNGLSEEGIAENRRVECFSNDIRILDPVVSTDILKTARPDTINFKGFVSVKGGEATWEFIAMQDGKPLKTFAGEGSLNDDLIWNIDKEKETMPTTESPVKFELLVKDKHREKIVLAKGELPVKQITTKLKSSLSTEDKRIDKFSLILFDFGKSELNDRNLHIIQAIKDNITPESEVIVTGYSDRIGNDVYNQKLSERRAKETANAFGLKNIAIRGIGEAVLIYDNEHPEGRFYSRTVEIVVETAVGGK